MNCNFYDIESLSNIFSIANFKEKSNTLDIYLLSDDANLVSAPDFIDQMKQRIYEKNKNFTGEIFYYDLTTKSANEYLAKEFGLCTEDPFAKWRTADVFDHKYRLRWDTDKGYDEEKDAYILGYNSYNYDTTMLACYFYEAFVVTDNGFNKPKTITIQDTSLAKPNVTAKIMRDHNNAMFEKYKKQMPSYLYKTIRGKNNHQDMRKFIRLNMIKSGRHLDVARINGKPQQIALKRLLGMLGYQILESDKLSQGQDTIHSADELYDLIAYNVSDVVNLKELFYHPAYQGQFSLKKGLLETYPDLIYNKSKTKYAPDIRPNNIKPDRLTIDSSSAQFATQCLCPYDHLKDMQYVSYMYPSEDKAKEYGIQRVNVLEEAKKFFYNLFPNPDQQALRDEFDSIYRYYKSIEGLNFNDSKNYPEDYRDIIEDIENKRARGQKLTQAEESMLTPKVLRDIPKTPCCIPYYDKTGKATSCFALFSTGGIHGAEYNAQMYQNDMDNWELLKKHFEYITSQYPDAPTFAKAVNNTSMFTLPSGKTVKLASAITINRTTNVVSWKPIKVPVLYTSKKNGTRTITRRYSKIGPNDDVGTLEEGLKFNKTLYDADVAEWATLTATIDEIKTLFPTPEYVIQKIEEMKAEKGNITMPDGTVHSFKTFIKGTSMAKATWKDIDKEKPELFKLKDDGSTTLNKKYTYTSFSYANHEDFTSYYPNLLRMMEAFKNPGLGHDRYADIFENKQKFGKIMKDKSRPEEERNRYSVLREGTKLILNSASGAGDASFDSNIKVNNFIISMRIIGQLFTWRIAQAQAYEGANIISTNTDGLYSEMEETINNQILARESKNINVEIEPEPMYLISKDSNNRIELSKTGGKILSASGGTLACHKGPNPNKSLAHPAIIDWALREYLVCAAAGYKGLSMSKPMDLTIAMNILKSTETNKKEFPDDIKWLNMFQNVLASNPTSYTYIYGLTDTDMNVPDGQKKPIIMQHYNRIFLMKDGTPNCVHLQAANAKAVTPDSQSTRQRQGLRPTTVLSYPALVVLQANGENIQNLLNSNRDIATIKITNINPEWYAYINNKSLYELTSEEIQFIKDNIDYDKYLGLLKDSYEKNWMNRLPGIDYSTIAEADDTEEEY